MGTGSFLGVKSGRDVTLTPHPLLVPWSWNGEAIPLLLLWAVRPVQSVSACTRLTFTLPQCLYKGDLYLTSVPVQGWPLPYLSACTRVTFTHFTTSDNVHSHRFFFQTITFRTRFLLPFSGSMTRHGNPYRRTCEVTNEHDVIITSSDGRVIWRPRHL